MSRRGISALGMATGLALVLAGCVLELEAEFRTAPNPAFTGEKIRFDAGSSKDTSRATLYRWDWDLDGTYDHATHDVLSHHAYGRSRTGPVRLMASEPIGWWITSDTVTHDVTVAGGTGPTAAFSATPNPPRVNHPVTFDASTSTDAAGTIAKYEWDLDGNGTYEVSGSSPTTTRTYTSSGFKTVRLRITDDRGRRASTTRKVMVSADNQPPNASFVTRLGQAMGEIVFDGAGSNDPEGPITRYEWDLDANGSFETDTGTNPVVSKTYAAGGTYNVSLRVTDNDRRTGTLTKAVTVNLKAPISGADTAPVWTKATTLEFRPTSGGPVRSVWRATRRAVVSGDTLFLPAQLSQGKGRLTGLPASLGLPRNVAWASRVKVRQDVDNGDTRGAGWMLLAFPHGGTACLTLDFDALPEATPLGAFQVSGGTGRAARLRGGGAFSAKLSNLSRFAISGPATLSRGPRRSVPANACQGLRRFIGRDLSHRKP